MVRTNFIQSRLFPTDCLRLLVAKNLVPTRNILIDPSFNCYRVSVDLVLEGVMSSIEQTNRTYCESKRVVKSLVSSRNGLEREGLETNVAPPVERTRPPLFEARFCALGPDIRFSHIN